MTPKETSVPPSVPLGSSGIERDQACAFNKVGDTHSTWPKLLLVEEAPSHHLLAERHYIGGVIQAPVFMGPELACTASSSLHLVHQEGTAMLSRDQGREKQTLVSLQGLHYSPQPLQAGAQLCTSPLCSKLIKPHSSAMQGKAEWFGS